MRDALIEREAKEFLRMEKLGWHSLGKSFVCECEVRHDLPIEACYLGEGAGPRLAAFAREKCGATSLVVSDENTRHAGGEPVLSALSVARNRA